MSSTVKQKYTLNIFDARDLLITSVEVEENPEKMPTLIVGRLVRVHREVYKVTNVGYDRKRYPAGYFVKLVRPAILNLTPYRMEDFQ